MSLGVGDLLRSWCLIARIQVEALLRADPRAVSALDAVETVDGPGLILPVHGDSTRRAVDHAGTTADALLDIYIYMSS